MARHFRKQFGPLEIESIAQFELQRLRRWRIRRERQLELSRWMVIEICACFRRENRQSGLAGGFAQCGRQCCFEVRAHHPLFYWPQAQIGESRWRAGGDSRISGW